MNPAVLAAKLNLPISSLHNDKFELSHQDFTQLLNVAAKESADPLFSLELSRRIDYQSLDVAMLLISTQETMLNIYPVLKGLYSYQNRGSRHQLELRGNIARHSVEFLFDKEMDINQHALLSIGGVFKTFKMAFGERLKIQRVCFVDQYKGELERLEAFFGCKVLLGSDFNGFEFSQSQLALKPDLHMEVTYQMRRHLSRGLQHYKSLIEIVTNSILLLMPLGDISKSRTATMLGVHPRTLQNLLNSKGLSYRSISCTVRDKQSKRFLKETDYSIEQIAQMVCYGSSAAFVRQFKEQNGTTPLQYRKQCKRLSR
ncbi:AraC family transcriptional regulator [Vibrio superstes NBRC 103154]|uniref:AraC family transcriptional regulator n=2 Tax=Vibrio superstes TaxID=198815 RepID=A0A511QSJ9_9VIBR|nr:AraC family transcriptional regulator [Vibrio superstes NBRC 103154]